MAVRVAIIGCGAIARRQHIPDLLAAGAELTAFASHTMASAQAARDDVDGSGFVTDDWRDVVGRDDVDAVTICTPNALHAPIAIAAAKAGKHVLVEKPFATSVADADAMIVAAQATGVVMMAAHNVRCAPPFVAMREAIAGGRIGQVTSVRVVFCHAGPEAWSAESTWFRDPSASGGGSLTDLGVHVADLLRFLLDDEVAQVTAMVDTLPIDGDALVVLKTVRGSVGSFHVGWRSTTGADQNVTVHGETGSLHFDPVNGATLTLPGKVPVGLPMAAADNPCAAFVRALQEGTPAIPSAHDGRAAVSIVAAAYEAARTAMTQEVEHP